MGEATAITWTDHTFNPWWGCERVSAACDHCYAEAFAHRLGMDLWGPGSDRRHFGDKHWAEPLRWDRKAAEAGERRRVFCASMADVFEDRRDLDADRDRLWELVEATPHLDWLLLTKRPENVRRLAARWEADGWPPNAWLGATVENQRRANERVPALAGVGAAVRFLSMEPLLGPVMLPSRVAADGELRPPVDWVILGGESGAQARRTRPEWMEVLIGQARRHGIAVHVKQAGRVLGREWGCPDSHGGDWSAWPEWARVREWPTATAV